MPEFGIEEGGAGLAPGAIARVLVSEMKREKQILPPVGRQDDALPKMTSLNPMASFLAMRDLLFVSAL
jgi:hypothetical protein